MWLGPLDRRITVEQRVSTQDPVYGTQIVVWVPLAQAWANVQDALPSKSEAVLAGGLALARNQTRVRMRYRSDMDSSMRIVVHGSPERVLQIVGGPAELGRREGIELMCESFSS